MNQYDVNSVPADRRIETSRTVAYSAATVFEAFRNPAILAQWWGPDGFTNTFYEFEFRAGGKWRFTMHAPTGQDFLNESRFLEIVEPWLIVFNHECAPFFQTHLRFEPMDSGCQIDWCMIFEDATTCANIAKFAGDGLEQNLNRLVAKLNAVR